MLIKQADARCLCNRECRLGEKSNYSLRCVHRSYVDFYAIMIWTTCASTYLRSVRSLLKGLFIKFQHQHPEGWRWSTNVFPPIPFSLCDMRRKERKGCCEPMITALCRLKQEEKNAEQKRACYPTDASHITTRLAMADGPD